MSTTPEVTVAAVITDQRNSGTWVLLTRRTGEPFKDRWCLPGGHIDPGELQIEAICREVEEETKLDFKPRFFGSFDENIPELNHHHLVQVYQGRAQGKPQLTAEVKEVKWSVGGQTVCWFSRVTNTKDRKCIRSWNRYPDCGDDFCPSENPNFECMEKGMNSMIIKNVGAHIEGVICNSYECNWCADNPTDDSLAQCDEEVGASPVETQTVTLQPGDEATCEFTQLMPTAMG